MRPKEVAKSAALSHFEGSVLELQTRIDDLELPPRASLSWKEDDLQRNGYRAKIRVRRFIQAQAEVRLRILASKEDSFFPKVRQWSDPVRSRCCALSIDTADEILARGRGGK